ncbi:hypothetical protein Thivi_1482 [Thiocystis violascens DSM 198]|uniref:Uncharacterized protein n=1 Tax=Thiocystis violascens (strain ATCC 17096 / DSM 198 / 6111) TaxID=765911 RepID=I3Y917_THIV6|nr:hypothetical protein Thivi_1482 [Thiocystis violascens DSM 198]
MRQRVGVPKRGESRDEATHQLLETFGATAFEATTCRGHCGFHFTVPLSPIEEVIVIPVRLDDIREPWECLPRRRPRVLEALQSVFDPLIDFEAQMIKGQNLVRVMILHTSLCILDPSCLARTLQNRPLPAVRE